MLIIIIIFFLCLAPGIQGLDLSQVNVRVLTSTLKLEEAGTAISGAKLLSDQQVDIVDVTFCIRFNFKLLGRYEGKSRLITIEDWRINATDSDFNLLWFGANFPFSFFGFGHPRAKGSYKSWLLKDPDSTEFELWASNRWSHVCIAYKRSTGHLRVVKDGKVLNLDHPDDELEGVIIPKDFLSKIYLARCSFDYKNTCSSPEGQISDFNVWGRFLSAEQLRDWTTCKSLIKGDLVNWDSAQLDLVNMTSQEQPMATVCIPPRPGHVIFPEKRNFTSHQEICKKMRGRASVVYDLETQTKMSNEIWNYPACGDRSDPAQIKYWVGWWDVHSEGTFTDVNTGQVLTKDMFAPWFHGEPNGDTLENCAIVWPDRNAWNDLKCSERQCSFCELEAAPDVQIRGLCLTTRFDTKYSWTWSMINQRHSFRGYTDTLLFWDEIKEEWKLELYSNKSIYATTQVYEYPFGNNVWTIYNDPCYEEDVNKVWLNVNTCNSSEFNCVDGYCISINSRCDGRVDCRDKSDEIGCSILDTDDSYLKDVPSGPRQDLNNTNDSKTIVSIDVDILNILEIKEVDNLITLQIQLKLTWLDTRLQMTNLKTVIDLNTLTPAFKAKIWVPELVFANTQEKMETRNDNKAFVTITRQGKYILSPRNILLNAYLFDGADNPISISRTYDGNFLCHFDMAFFPFDTQKCSISLVMKGNSGKFVEMNPNTLRYLGPIDLTQYFVKNTSMFYHQSLLNESVTQVEITFGRRLLGAILTTYLPTFLLCIVSFSTNYFKAFFFEAIVTVNLTSLLTLTTLFISVSNSLPKTAYIKMIDIWLIVTLFIPFTEVILHTFIDSLRMEDERGINHHGKKVVVTDTKGPVLPKVNTMVEEGKAKAFINGKIITIDESKADRLTRLRRIGIRNPELIARKEEEEVLARSSYYEKLIPSSSKKMNVAMAIASKGLPTAFFLFTIVYFIIGFIHYSD